MYVHGVEGGSEVWGLWFAWSRILRSGSYDKYRPSSVLQIETIFDQNCLFLLTDLEGLQILTEIFVSWVLLGHEEYFSKSPSCWDRNNEGSLKLKLPLHIPTELLPHLRFFLSDPPLQMSPTWQVQSFTLQSHYSDSCSCQLGYAFMLLAYYNNFYVYPPIVLSFFHFLFLLL